MNDNLSYNLGQLGIAAAPSRRGAIGLANEAAFGSTFLSQPLTQYAVGWLRDHKALLDLLEFFAPEVRAPRRFEFRKANAKDAFVACENGEDIRALHGEFKRIQSSGEIVDSKTIHKGLSKLVDADELRDDPMAEETAVGVLTGALIRADILRAVVLLAAAAVNAAKTWSTGADADLDLLAAVADGGDAAGLDPNRLLFGRTAWQNRLKGLRSLDTAAGHASAGLSPEALAAWLGIDAAMICRERYQSGSGKAALVTNNIVLAYNAQSGATKDDPSNIKRFVTPSEGGAFRVFRREIASDLVEVTVSHYSNVVLTSSSGVRKLTIS